MWRFEDGGSLVYDWEAKTYTITLPTGTVTISVGGTQAVITDSAVDVTSGTINLKGPVNITGPLKVTGDIWSGGTIIDTGGNTPNHKH